MTDLVDLVFDRQAIKGFEPQAREKFDARFERLIGITEGPIFVGLHTFDSGGIRCPPMSGHRIAGPDRDTSARRPGRRL